MAEAFPGAVVVLDSIPRWFSRLTLRGLRLTRGYTAPPMPWGLDAGQQQSLRAWSPRIARVTDLKPEPLGWSGRLVLAASRIPVLGGLRPSFVRLDIAR